MRVRQHPLRTWISDAWLHGAYPHHKAAAIQEGSSPLSCHGHLEMDKKMLICPVILTLHERFQKYKLWVLLLLELARRYKAICQIRTSGFKCN